MLLIISTICSDPAKNDITKFAVKEKWKKDITFIQGLSLNNEISCILREYMSQKNKMKYLILQLMFVLVMIIFLSLVTEKKKQTPKKRPPKKQQKNLLISVLLWESSTIIKGTKVHVQCHCLAKLLSILPPLCVVILGMMWPSEFSQMRRFIACREQKAHGKIPFVTFSLLLFLTVSSLFSSVQNVSAIVQLLITHLLSWHKRIKLFIKLLQYSFWLMKKGNLEFFLRKSNNRKGIWT